jgi:predicted O-methyltransferase YrrM
MSAAGDAQEEANVIQARQNLIEAHRSFINAIKKFRAVAGHSPWFLLDSNIGQIDQYYLTGCLMLKDRIEMLRRIPKGGRIVEVGTFRGNFAYQILSIVQPDELITIDIDYSRFDRDRLSKHPRFSSIKMVTGNSYDMISQLPDNTFDMIYIDGDHTYPFVKKDIEAAHPKLRTGGLMIANDYTSFSPYNGHKYGVVKAVNEFINLYQYNVEFFALQAGGYHDIAMRKMGRLKRSRSAGAGG